MMPIGDDNSGNTIRPYINYLLIAANIVVFIFFQGMGGNQAFLMSFATVPQEIISGNDVVGPNGLMTTPIPVWGTIFTAMFMHGSIAHIGGNMLYLWIFGDNLENRMGHGKYLAFYLLTGVLATLSHVFLSSALGRDLLIPSLGASGAISGVLGGYLVLFPKNQVRVIALNTIINVPAIVSLGIWIAMQVVSGMSMFGGEGSGGGVAYAAHIGGFIAGMILVKFFAGRAPATIEDQYRRQ
ncbi:MAG: rhomboid family intramembrane serine protease [Ferruginibacter sp.]